ncbi:hypothetical protein IRB23M11_23160 [Alkalibacterium sp. m-11]
MAILFFLLAIGNFTGSSVVLTLAGYEGIIWGFSAIYVAMIQVLNELYGKRILPIVEYKAEGHVWTSREINKAS